MAGLWGSADEKTSTGTVAVAANGLVTGTGTDFANEAEVGDFLVTDAESLRIVSITNSTSLHVQAQTLGGTIATASANQYGLQEGPQYVVTSEVGANATQTFGVDTTEVGVTAGIAHAGWVRRTTGSGTKSGRVTHEVLVASRTISGDAADDTEMPDS
jgi:hypothetical protein